MADTYFVTPVRYKRPPYLPSTPDRDRKPAMFFGQDSLIGQGINVYVLLDGTTTEIQPPLYSDFTTVYLGGHYNGPLTQAEINLLTANGYGSYLTTDVPAGLSGGGTSSSSAGYGGTGYGSGGYGS